MTIKTGVVTWSSQDPLTSVNLHPGLFLPKAVEIEVFNEPGVELQLEIDVIYDQVLRRYVATEVKARRKREGQEINSLSLRSVRIQEILRRGLSGVVRVESEDGEVMPFPLSPMRAAEIVALGPSNRETLLWIARVYRVAEVLNLRPAKEVQDQFGLKVSTAAVWIRRARDTGALTDG